GPFVESVRRASSITLAHLLDIEAQSPKIDALDKRAIGERALVRQRRSADMRNNKPRHLFQVGQVQVEHPPSLVDRHAHRVESTFRVAQRADLREVIEERPARSTARTLLPLVIIANESLQIAIEWSQARKAIEERGDEALIGEQVIDERKDVKR